MFFEMIPLLLRLLIVVLLFLLLMLPFYMCSRLTSLFVVFVFFSVVFSVYPNLLEGLKAAARREFQGAQGRARRKARRARGP